MKVAITSMGDTPQSKMDSRFGRCGFFAIYNTKDFSMEFHPNPNKDADGGAGPASAQYIASKGIEIVYSGHFGGKAKDLLDQLNIKTIAIDTVDKKIEDLIFKIKQDMPKMDGTGPEKKGQKTGRGLGKCATNSSESLLQKLGKGMGLRRKEGDGKGQGKRLQGGK